MPKISDLISIELLEILQESYENYIPTSAAVHELDGAYVTEKVTSKYCELIVKACENLEGNGAGICCKDSRRIAEKSIDRREPYEEVCTKGFIAIYSVPVMFDDEPIGAVCAAISDPPRDKEVIKQIADKYKLDEKIIQEVVKEHVIRPDSIKIAFINQIEIVANTIAALYEKFYSLKQQKERSDRAISVMASMATASSKQEALRKATELMPLQAGCDRCVSRLWDVERGCFTPGPSWGLTPEEQREFDNSTIRPGSYPAIDKVFETKEPLIVSENKKNKNMIPFEHIKTFNIGGNAIYLPILLKEDVVGVIIMYSQTGTDDRYTDEVVGQLEAILTTLGIVLENISHARES